MSQKPPQRSALQQRIDKAKALAARKTSPTAVLNDVVGGSSAGPDPARPASRIEIPPAPQATTPRSSGEGEGAASIARPRIRDRAFPERTSKTTAGPDHLRVPFTYRKDQLATLEQMKATLYERTGKWVDKSTLAREAFDLLFAQWPDLAQKPSQSSADPEAA